MENKRISVLDLKITKLHNSLFREYRIYTVTFSLLVYILGILFFGEYLKISCNYLVILPLIALAQSFGFWTGIISGTAALPFNLLLFYIIGHPEYSPASKLIAELSGILVGTVLGYLSDFFDVIKEEINLRKRTESDLNKALAEKELLLKEIHHRVKNNLNVIKSITMLQSTRIDDSNLKREFTKLNNRIMSMALVQDLLFTNSYSNKIDLKNYIDFLIKYLLNSRHSKKIKWIFNCKEKNIYLESKKITSLGLIINETVENSFKYAFKDHPSPELSVFLSREGDYYLLQIGDNGPGFPDSQPDEGLGRKIIPSLVKQIDGEISFYNSNGAWTKLKFYPEEQILQYC